MKRILIAAITSLMTILTATAQGSPTKGDAQQSLNLYIIDGRHVDNFDGSQLIGRQIKFYEMKQQESITIHNIFTIDNWRELKENLDSTEVISLQTKTVLNVPDNGSWTIVGQPSDTITASRTPSMRMETMSDPLIILDGELYMGKVGDIKPADIKSINVYKRSSDVARSYGEQGKNGVIEIFTLRLPDAITYFIDGEPATKDAFKSLSPENIKKVTVLKRGSWAAMKTSPDGRTNDIYQITTK